MYNGADKFFLFVILKHSLKNKRAINTSSFNVTMPQMFFFDMTGTLHMQHTVNCCFSRFAHARVKEKYWTLCQPQDLVVSEAYQKAIVLFNDEVIGFSDMKSRLLLTFLGNPTRKFQQNI